MAEASLSKLSMGILLSRLHASILEFLGRLDRTIEVNASIGQGEISELRNHITARLNRGEEAVENKKLLAVLNLLAMNEGAVEYIKVEAEEWLAFVDAIEKRITEGGEEASEEERKELEEIGNALETIKAGLRK